MPKVYVEAQPNGGPEGSALEDHVQTTRFAAFKHTRSNRLAQKERPRSAGRAAPDRQKGTGPLAGALLCGTGFEDVRLRRLTEGFISVS